MLRSAMSNQIQTGPDILEQVLASAIRSNMELIRQLAGKPRHIPGDEQYHEIARHLVEHLKRNGVEKVVRRELPRVHSFPHPAPKP